MGTKTPPVCQSCAMPMEQPEQFGTEKDGSASGEYCRYCYQQGRFTAELTLGQMQEKLIKLALDMKFMPEAEARKLAATVLPGLKRWQRKPTTGQKA